MSTGQVESVGGDSRATPNPVERSSITNCTSEKGWTFYRRANAAIQRFTQHLQADL
jgi:hypothetical protein